MAKFQFVFSQYARFLHEDWSKALPEARSMARESSKFTVWIGGFATAGIGLLIHESSTLGDVIGWTSLGLALVFLTTTLVLVIVHRHLFNTFEVLSWGHHFWLLNQLRVHSLGEIKAPPELSETMSDNEVIESLTTHFDMHPDFIARLREEPAVLRAHYLNTYNLWSQYDRAGQAEINRLVSIFDGKFIEREDTAAQSTDEAAQDQSLRAQAKTGANIKNRAVCLSWLETLAIVGLAAAATILGLAVMLSNSCGGA